MSNTTNLDEIDAKRAAQGFVRWLLPDLAQEFGFDRAVVPLSADDLTRLRAEGWLTRNEILDICIFSHAAACVQPHLASKVKALRLKAELPERFEQICASELPGAVRECGQSLQLKDLFLRPPAPLGKAIGRVRQLWGAELRLIPRKNLVGVRSIIFEHPSDRATLATLKAIPGVGTLTSKAVDFFSKSDAMALLGGAILATPASMPKVYKVLAEACQILDVAPIPPLYIKFGSLEAHTLGADEPYIVLASMVLSLCNDDELLFVLGHELGHIKAGHVPYHTLAKGMKDSAALASNITLGLSQILFDVTVSPVLARWSRRSEFTADRAGYLVCQDQDVALRALMKLAGYPPASYKEMHTRSIVAQARRFHERLSDHTTDRLFNVSNLWSASHPYPVARAYELLEWLQEGGDELLRMSQGEREDYAKLINIDPHMAELQQAVIRAVADWAHQNFQVHRSTARRLARQMILGASSGKHTELERILQIQFSVKKTGANAIEHCLYILANQNGKPVRVTVPLDKDPSWDALPDEIRRGFIQSGKKEMNLDLYHVK
jgi:Zn-dependent protease with chaperone function